MLGAPAGEDQAFWDLLRNRNQPQGWGEDWSPDQPTPERVASVPHVAGRDEMSASPVDRSQVNPFFQAVIPLLKSGPFKDATVASQNVSGALKKSAADMALLPGNVMKPNPYDAGSEMAGYHDAQKFNDEVKWAADMAGNTAGTGGMAAFTPGRAGGVYIGAGGGKAKIPEPKALVDAVEKKAATDGGGKVPVDINAPYISSPVRVANPGIYKRPDVIASEAAARVEPEHPALKELFGITRRDLYDISQQGRRQGNMTPDLWMPKRPGAAPDAVTAVMNPANEQRIIDTLAEARKHPGLEQGMVPWYVMDPLYQRMAKLVGPERAAKEYHDFNMSMTPFSAGSSVPNEINRGTAANMMRTRGEYDQFEKYGGLAANKRSETPGYPEILRDVNGVMGHLNQASPVRRYMETGKHGYGKDQVKIDLYSGASGVPETGFQTTGAVPDAHFTRAVGVPDARKIPVGFNDYMGGTEYRHIGPWYRDKIAKPLDLEAVPAQSLMWGTYGPQTGVKTKIGAGKLELLSKQMWERAQKLGIDPKEFRDKVLRGGAHAGLAGLAAPLLADALDGER